MLSEVDLSQLDRPNSWVPLTTLAWEGLPDAVSEWNGTSTSQSELLLDGDCRKKS